MLTLRDVLYLIGALLVGTSLLNALERRVWNAAFWAIIAVPCVLGDQILAALKTGTKWPAQAMGAGVIALALLAPRLRPHVGDGDPAAREASAARLGDRLFLPALAIPGIVTALVLHARFVGWPVTRLIDPSQVGYIALGIAVVLALAAAVWVTRSHPIGGLTEGRRLIDTLGWPVVLPMLLATLGTVFQNTGVGKAIADIVGAVIPVDSWLACMLAFGLGMVVFTMIMGNAFAAFPVMMGGIGLPFLVTRHGADPAALGAIGMVTGYCGTLMTPMAANFNIVPVVLLELPSQYSVIRVQIPTALVLLTANLIIMSICVFR